MGNNQGSAILNGLTKGTSSIMNIANKVSNGIGKGLDFVSKIPVVGDVVDEVVNKPIPLIGRSVRDVVGVAGKGLKYANMINDALVKANGNSKRIPPPLPSMPLPKLPLPPLPGKKAMLPPELPKKYTPMNYESNYSKIQPYSYGGRDSYMDGYGVG